MKHEPARLRLYSLTDLLLWLREHPHVQLYVRGKDGLTTPRHGATFVGRARGVMRFRDCHHRPVLVGLMPDQVYGHEWRLKFFPGGFRFRRAGWSMTFFFQEA